MVLVIMTMYEFHYDRKTLSPQFNIYKYIFYVTSFKNKGKKQKFQTFKL